MFLCGCFASLCSFGAVWSSMWICGCFVTSGVVVYRSHFASLCSCFVSHRGQFCTPSVVALFPLLCADVLYLNWTAIHKILKEITRGSRRSSPVKLIQTASLMLLFIWIIRYCSFSMLCSSGGHIIKLLMNWDLWLFNMTCHFRQRLRPRGPLDAWLWGLCLSSNPPMPACSIKCPSALQQLKDFGLRKLFFRGGHPRTETLFVIQCAKPDSPGS